MVNFGLVASGQDPAPLIVVLDDSFDLHVPLVPLDQCTLDVLILPIPTLVHVHVEDFATPGYNINRDLVRAQVLDESQIRSPTA
jgi:hypothetical protein